MAMAVKHSGNISILISCLLSCHLSSALLRMQTTVTLIMLHVAAVHKRTEQVRVEARTAQQGTTDLGEECHQYRV
eukprot:COSAG02_NODE_13339_length_1407_cov_1.630734_3_plen_75_part_00